MVADMRTNAGIDNVASFRKLHLFERREDFVAARATAGSLTVI